MKKILFSLLLFVVMATNNGYAQYFPIDTAKLNAAYRELVSKPNTLKKQKLFFDAFPNTWMEFIMTYQYIPNNDYDLIMYNTAYHHVRVLGEKMTLIKDSIYCQKLVNLAVGGKWDADAPNYLQKLLHQEMSKRMDGMLKVISKLRKGHQMQFWQFYWSNIVKSKDLEMEYDQLHKVNTDAYPEEMKVMSIAFQYFYNGIYIPHDFRKKEKRGRFGT